MFKDRIAELRVNNDLSLAQFAEAVGVSKATVSLYEAGKQNPSKKTIAKICEAFNVSEEWLFGEDEVTAGTRKGAKKPSKKKKKGKAAKAAKAAVSTEDEPVEPEELPEDEAVESEELPEDEAVESEELPEDEPVAADELTEEVEEVEEDETEPETEAPAEAEAETEEEAKLKEDPKPKTRRSAAGTRSAGTKKVNKPSKKTTALNMKGENKMAKKKINRLVPPIPFAFYGKAADKGEEQGSDRKAKANEMKEQYKALLKKYHEENVDARKSSAKKRKDKREQAFDRFMEMQETFADFISEDPFVLPFIPMYSLFPKKMMKRFMELERVSNEFFEKQAEAYADFCKERKTMLLDMMKASVIKNEDQEEDEEEKKG